jgi:hypothetical protein
VTLPFKTKTCVTCHFFVRTHFPDGTQPFTLDVSEEDRVRAALGSLSWQREFESLSCHKGVWDEGLGIHGEHLLKQISKVRRNGKCFYFEHSPGMLLPAAEKLQEASMLKSNEGLKYRLAIYGLTLTVIALGLKVFLGI